MEALDARLTAVEARVARVLQTIWITFGIGQAFSLILTAVRVFYIPHSPAGPVSTGNQQVHVSSARSVNPPDTGKTYLTTAEVAARENVSPRTLLTWIQEGRVSPAPEKSDRAWIIPADYRIQPPSADDCR